MSSIGASYAGVYVMQKRQKEKMEKKEDETRGKGESSIAKESKVSAPGRTKKVRAVALKNAPNNLKLMSPKIQKDIVNAAVGETTNAIISDIGDSLFSILVDESRDVSIKEQMVVMFRYVDNKGYVIERFMGIEHVASTTAFSLKTSIDALFARHHLSISQLHGQGYDGASNMNGEFNVSNVINIVGASSKRREQALKVIEALSNDLQLQELRNRFTEVNIELLLCLACLSTNNSFSAFNTQKLVRLAELYPSDFSTEQLMALEIQLENYIDDIHSNTKFQELNGISDLAKKLVEIGKHKEYPLVYFLITLGLVLPVATASVKKVFSGMNFVKNRLRNRMGDQWMNDSLVVYIEKDIFNDIDNELIVKRFQL
ncbi:zinc finger MYM-type protein 1-like [Prunus persica]|uniref:zinc finger MYM-type protein 1-like n=1 Tax=Prunus persica TaxID=3760 RepID=UPI0009AB58F8|nr:zinc finger MYM-type protein 1-like [Prunus persica]